MEDIDALKRKLVVASHILADQGLVEGFGHVSVRIEGTDRFLIPPRMSPALVQFEDILTMNLAGERLEGTREPNSEHWIHSCTYRARPDINSVAHTHSKMVVALGVTGQVVRPVEHNGTAFARGVPLFMRPGYINTQQLGDQMASQLGDKAAIMLRGHGAVIVGSFLERATLVAIALEQAAEAQYKALAIGEPIYLTDEEIAEGLPDRVEVPGTRKPISQRAWDYYVSRVSR